MFRFFSKLKRKNLKIELSDNRFVFYDIGFHGDKYLLKIVDLLGNNSKFFYETGSNVGSTLSYFSKRFQDVQCYSCEPNIVAFGLSKKNSEAKNCTIYNETSQNFLIRIEQKLSHSYTQTSLFWIDAHGYGFNWPLIEEMVFVMKNFKDFFLLVDDFQVPGIPEFGYDIYQGQVCSHEYIKEHLNSFEYYLYYPTYTEHTSKHHPLRGWGLYTSKRIDFPSFDIDFVKEFVFKK